MKGIVHPKMKILSVYVFNNFLWPASFNSSRSLWTSMEEWL